MLRSEHIPAERQYYVAEGKTSYCLDFAVLCARAGVDVECDGDSWHLRPEAVVADNARDNFMARLGWPVLRFSSRQLSEPTIGDAVRVIRETSEHLGGLELPNRANAVLIELAIWLSSTACGSQCSPLAQHYPNGNPVLG